MAYDKLVDSAALDASLTRIADAIRGKTGKTATLTLGEMPSEISSIEAGGVADSIIDRSISGVYENDSVASIGTSAFYNCVALTSIRFPMVMVVYGSAFYDCSALTRADFSALTGIGANAFRGCANLTAMILRGNSVCELWSSSAFTGSGIANRTGYIYVPAALVDSYKAATNWASFADQIRALEDMDA